MTKGKRALSLAMSIIALSMTACSEDYTYPDYTWKDNKIVTVGGKNYTFGSEDANDDANHIQEVFSKFEGTKNSAQSYFNVAKSVLAQAVTTTTSGIDSIIDTKIEALHDTWKTNSRTNGTSYKEEQEKTFDSEGVEDEDELRDKYIAEEKVSENEDNFKTVKDGTTNAKEDYYLSEELTKEYVADNAPYHVSHILVKVDASSSGAGYYNGQISSDDAKQIGNVVKMLSNGTNFGSVAQLASDDGSAAQYGELYTKDSMIAMQKDTSYVNEFKLGVYAYDTFLNSQTTSNAEHNTTNKSIREQLRVPGTVAADGDVTESTVASEFEETPVANGQAFGIPLSVAFTMQYVAELDTNPSSGRSVTTDSKKSVTATQYPRNIYFNNYFNYHGVSFIYDDTDEYNARFMNEVKQIAKSYVSQKVMTAAKYSALIVPMTNPSDLADVEELSWKYDEYKFVKNLLDQIQPNYDKVWKDYNGELVGYQYDETTGANNMASFSGKKILTDGSHDIIVARAGTAGDSGYQGIHFIVVNNDPFVNSDTKYQYYRVNVPSVNATDPADSTDYSTNPSFINFVQADANSNTTYNARKKTVENAISNAIDNISFTIYDQNKSSFEEKYGTSFDNVIGKDVADAINRYITTTEASSEKSANDTLDDAWVSYTRQLNLQKELVSARMVPASVGVAAFESGNIESEYEDICHVE